MQVTLKMFLILTAKEITMQTLILILEISLMALWGIGIITMMFFPLIDKIIERLEK